MNENKERAAFEAWVTSSACEIPAGSAWESTCVKLCWDAWKASAIIAADRAQRQAGQEPALAVLREFVDAFDGVIAQGGYSVTIDDKSSGWVSRARAALNSPQSAAQPEPVRQDWDRDIDAAQFIEQRALIDGKDTEISTLTAERDNAFDLWTVAHAERSAEMMRGAEQEAEIAALRQDAERYRYLRLIGGQTWAITFTDGTTKRRAVGEYYDSVVDEAIAQAVQP